jgi:hypothetical protein
MPTISMFYGIVSISISTTTSAIRRRTSTQSIKGKTRLYLSLMETYSQVRFQWGSYAWYKRGLRFIGRALLADWQLAVNGETPFPIDPLK